VYALHRGCFSIRLGRGECSHVNVCHYPHSLCVAELVGMRGTAVIIGRGAARGLPPDTVSCPLSSILLDVSISKRFASYVLRPSAPRWMAFFCIQPRDATHLIRRHRPAGGGRHFLLHANLHAANAQEE
jgi:hypothetical protein